VPRAASSLLALYRGDGLQSAYISSTSSGMSIHRSVLTSCSIRAMGNKGLRSLGPAGSCVPGCRGGFGRFGMSAMTLYHCFGISFSESIIFVSSMGPSR
jgi:hypothetical protein